MRRFFTTLLLLTLLGSASAQELPLDSKGESTVKAEDGNLAINIAGMNFIFGSDGTAKSANSKSAGKVHFGFAGIDAPSYNHLALIEIGSNFVANTDFSSCSDEVAAALAFSNRKAVNVTINLMTMNVPLSAKRTVCFSMGFGFAMENYTFDGDVSLKYNSGNFELVELDQSIKKSKMLVDYIHIPLLFDFNIRKGFFISAGASLDILCASRLTYKRPKTTIEGTLPLNPVQVGVTGRIGWRRIYAFVNYSPMNMYKKASNVSANRVSAGMGFYF
ncbi:MAG: outer membrane beta-barrel protein [Alistipes sp.]|nr:outer membrane beta-barrel protein [Alistipes sp.]